MSVVKTRSRVIETEVLLLLELLPLLKYFDLMILYKTASNPKQMQTKIISTQNLSALLYFSSNS